VIVVRDGGSIAVTRGIKLGDEEQREEFDVSSLRFLLRLLLSIIPFLV
jgi:hypothetical protein